MSCSFFFFAAKTPTDENAVSLSLSRYSSLYHSFISLSVSYVHTSTRDELATKIEKQSAQEKRKEREKKKKLQKAGNNDSMSYSPLFT